MEWWVVISLIASNVLDDAIATFCTLAIMRRKKVLAFALTVVLTYLVSWSVRNYALHYYYVHPVAWASGVGCILGIYADRWFRKKERLKNLNKARQVKKNKQKPPETIQEKK